MNIYHKVYEINPSEILFFISFSANKDNESRGKLTQGRFL